MEHSIHSVSASTQQSVLIVQRSSNLDGSAFSGLLLADGLREAGWETHVAFGLEGPIIERYEKSRHNTYVVPHKNWLRRKGTPQFVKDVVLEVRKAAAFCRLIDAIQPDVVYLNTAVSLAGAVAAWAHRCAVVWHLREMFADVGGEMHAPQWALPIVRGVFRGLATRLVANSEAAAINMLGENALNHVEIIPNAVRTRFFREGRSRPAARQALQLPVEGMIIGVPGTFRPVKGHDFFFRAAESLLREDSSLHVAVTGGVDSPHARHVLQQVGNIEVATGRVHFLGWVEDIPAFYRTCDIICIPSRSESFGRTVIEAFAVGTPVVATAVGGLQDIVTDGKTGLLVPYGDLEALVRALRRLLDTPHLRQRISTRALQVAEKKYHERVYKRRVAALTASVLEDGHYM